MNKKCIYCRRVIPEESAVDICRSCGISVWGEKMFRAIQENMQDAKEKGDLDF